MRPFSDVVARRTSMTLPLRSALGALGCALLVACGDSGSGPESAVATSIQLSHTTVTIDDGAGTSVTASVLDQRGRPIPNAALSWRSADATVASVHGGQISGQKQGRTHITASSGTAHASVEVVVRPVVAALLVPGGTALLGVTDVPVPIVVRIVDRHGLGLSGIAVRFAASQGDASPETALTDAQGYAKATWTLGPGTAGQAATVSIDALAPVTVTAHTTPASATVVNMVYYLDDHIAGWAVEVGDLLPRNPHLATHIASKVAMLRTPTLAGEILRDRRWSEINAVSVSGRTVPLVAVFPLEGMRAEATQSTRTLERGLPVLEDFMGTAFPTDEIRIWEGFVLGNSGGGGTLNMEDRATYEARTPSTRLPYDAILLHELAHSYIGNESMTQFLELYQHNVLYAGSTSLTSWTYTRGWVAQRATNEGVHALLDVYELIGRDAMAAAFRAAYPLHPPYGQPLSAAVRQAFVDQAPDAVKTQVAAKVAMIQA